MSRMAAMVSRFQCPSLQPVDKASDKASDKGGLSRAPKMSKLQSHAFSVAQPSTLTKLVLRPVLRDSWV